MSSLGEGVLVRWHAPRIILENGAIWRILKCISIKFQGKNSLKISVFITTITEKNASLLGRSTTAFSLRFWKNGAIGCILKCILIKYQGNDSLKISVFIATTTKKKLRFCDSRVASLLYQVSTLL